MSKPPKLPSTAALRRTLFQQLNAPPKDCKMGKVPHCQCEGCARIEIERLRLVVDEAKKLIRYAHVMLPDKTYPKNWKERVAVWYGEVE